MNWSFNNNIHKSIIYSNIPLSGSYRYKGIFTVSHSEFELPELKKGMNNSKPIILEYCTDTYTDFKRIKEQEDENEESFRSFDFRKELMAILTLITNANFLVEYVEGFSRELLGEQFFQPQLSTFTEESRIKYDNEYLFKRENYLGDEVLLPLCIWQVNI